MATSQHRILRPLDVDFDDVGSSAIVAARPGIEVDGVDCDSALFTDVKLARRITELHLKGFTTIEYGGPDDLQVIEMVELFVPVEEVEVSLDYWMSKGTSPVQHNPYNRATIGPLERFGYSTHR